ncbi:hypothetical protein EHYA_07043 [Embleya hyalina]|uniref:Uncharacterized protein n=2 Tax=Embleya hyalina TaxID=516124 RepID=A0A401YXK4_9ACTN|nr:hypothetical protein EHYA_07043 [Embleya hyalina]
MTLAASGATTLVGLMVSESWTQARTRLAAFFTRGGSEPTGTEQELDAARRELTTAQAEGNDVVAADIEAEWRTRLRRALEADPAAAADLRALLDELTPLAATPAAPVTNTITGGTQHGPVLQGRDFSDLTFHTQPPPSPETPPVHP